MRAKTPALIVALTKPEACQSISRWLSACLEARHHRIISDIRSHPGRGDRPLRPLTGVGILRRRNPVVSLADSLNHRLMDFHPFGIEARSPFPASLPSLRSFAAKKSGSALILVLWGLLLLGMAVFGVVDMVELSVEHTTHSEQALEARGPSPSAASRSGSIRNCCATIRSCTQTPDPTHQLTVTIQSEGARLNLNYVLAQRPS